uniref:Mitochondrial import inner membrane translocase subunit TIM22 n=1 Tax=Globisporangium ultimum (strain ATCC 200006 / CBS 805.95 / DAOM BR144) TaxID=431595 RepID=K3X3J3_GLOUD
MAASSTTLTLRERWTRFVDEEMSTFVFSTGVYAAAICAKEYKELQPTPQRMQQALRKTGAKMPLITLSCAIGIAGMKMCILGVSRLREDYTRSSVLVACPVAGALLRAHRGPRAMAIGALSFGALGYGSDYLFSMWHRRNADAEEVRYALSLREHHNVHHNDAFFIETLQSNAYLLEASQK